MSVIRNLMQRVAYVMIALSLLFSANSAPSLSEIIETATDGFFIRYEVEERAQMMADLIFPKDGDKFEPGTKAIAKEIVYNVIIQFISGNADPDAVTNLMKSLPREDLDRTDIKTRTPGLSAAMIDLFFLNDTVSSKLPQNIKHFLEHSSHGIHELYVYLIDTEYEDVYEIRANYVTDDAEIVQVETGIYFDSVTGLVYGKNNDGVFGIGYDYDSKQYVLENPANVWMRKYGFNIAYDIIGNIVFLDCETVRLKFNCEGRDWMIQLWKGNYTHFTNGAEIALYYLEDGRQFHYTCAGPGDEVEMRMDVNSPDGTLFKRDWVKHWWLSGYQPGPAYDAGELEVDASIRFNSTEMAKAFKQACDENSIKTTVDGATVSFVW